MMYRATSLLLLVLFALPVWAATYYIDAAATDGGSGTENSPYNTWSDVTLAANDTVYIKGFIPDAISVTSTSGVTIDNWPGYEGGVDCASTVAIGITITSSDENTLNDLVVKNCVTHGVLHNLSSATSADSYVNRIWVQNTIGPQTTAGNFKVGTCFWAGVSGSPNSSTQNRVTYTDTLATGCKSHGYNAEQETVALYIRAKSSNAGADGLHGAHGFSSHPRVNSVSNSWSLHSGTIYYRNRVFSGDVEQRLCSRGTGAKCLVKQTANDTTLNDGEWATWANGTGSCVNGSGCIAVNFGVDPTTFTEIKWSRFITSVTYIDTISEYTRDSSVGAEGHGYDCDDLSINCTYQRALAQYNENSGFYAFQAGSPTYISTIALRNGGVGYSNNGAENARYYNTASVLNGSMGYRSLSDFEYDMEFVNNLSAFNSSRGYGIDPQSAAELNINTTNLSFGNGSAEENFTPTYTATNPNFVGGNAPLTAEQLRPKNDSTNGLGTYSSLAKYDFDGKRFGIDPYVGPFSESRDSSRSSYTTRTDY